MATIRETYSVDDMDPEVRDDVQTITFALDGKEYEIDLGDKNRERLFDVLAEFIAKGRKNVARQTRAPRKPAAPKERNENDLIRKWLRDNGHEVSSRGRIKADLVVLYRNHKDDAPAETQTVEPQELVDAPDDTDDTKVQAWWSSKGYKPQAKVNSLMRAQYRAGHGLAKSPHVETA